MASGCSVICVKWQAAWQDADWGPNMLPHVLVVLWAAVLRMRKGLLVPGRVWATGARQEEVLLNSLSEFFAVSFHSIFTSPFGNLFVPFFVAFSLSVLNHV